MPKWEYRVCAVHGDAPGHVEEELNSRLKNLGEEGWRFVETIYGQHSLPLLLFKKHAAKPECPSPPKGSARAPRGG